jgi:hypothetical protein
VVASSHQGTPLLFLALSRSGADLDPGQRHPRSNAFHPLRESWGDQFPLFSAPSRKQRAEDKLAHDRCNGNWNRTGSACPPSTLPLPRALNSSAKTRDWRWFFPIRRTTEANSLTISQRDDECWCQSVRLNGFSSRHLATQSSRALFSYLPHLLTCQYHHPPWILQSHLWAFFCPRLPGRGEH